MKKILLFIPIIALLILSCQKESHETACTTSMASISGSYKITSLKYKASSTSTEQDFLATLDPCQQDDIISFNSIGTVDYQDAGIICSPNGSSTVNWSLSGNNITIDGKSGTIELFDCHKLVVININMLVPGDKISATYTKK